MKKLVVLPLVAMVLVAAVSPAFAHSGRTNSAGCHHDSRTGGYHCH
ncbi:YHYH domain-containing protein [Sphaerospermopsis kisseleviana CS-549]|uniref:YHYH domain-containing protein n=1 Tax=Sphaerospermopsis kisseleviana CS-549 TaxID=3021783 RepID=A0ABT4ZRP0_9CYAN|nr:MULTISPECIES: YHYH domain-containing protein [Sphaerospermopsis]MBD2135228.1 YHYH domain-containing protein [Sphaerospermopsis sp. FACHB-1094]MDB9442063.1 YHYH domain-containing protein [Sphaerospermopsis kisseleviana CS-549]